MIPYPRNFTEWFAFHGGEECVTKGANREDFYRCWCAALDAIKQSNIRNAKGQPLTASDIIKKYIKDNGFDGLYIPGECACTPDDLFPCGNDPSICEAGYKAPCDCGEGCDFHIGPKKTEERAVLNHTTTGCTAHGQAPSTQTATQP